VVEEQSAVAEDINRSITTISEVAYHSAEASQQTYHSSEEMARLAGELPF
jgi:methyl-accepting chemotaxis protein